MFQQRRYLLRGEDFSQSTTDTDYYTQVLPSPSQTGQKIKQKVYLEDYNFKNEQLEVIAGVNSTFRIEVTLGPAPLVVTNVDVTLTPGIYATITDFLLMANVQLQAAVTAAGANAGTPANYSITYDSITKRYTFYLDTYGTNAAAGSKSELMFNVATLDPETYKLFGAKRQLITYTHAGAGFAIISSVMDNAAAYYITPDIYTVIKINDKQIGKTIITNHTVSFATHIGDVSFGNFDTMLGYQPMLLDELDLDQDINQIDIKFYDSDFNNLTPNIDNSWRITLRIGGENTTEKLFDK